MGASPRTPTSATASVKAPERARTMDEEARREAARRRVKAKRNFRNSLVSYIIINAFLVVIWVLGDGGAFWPGWVMAAWGVGLAFQWWNAYRGDQEVTEEDIRRELGDSN